MFVKQLPMLFCQFFAMHQHQNAFASVYRVYAHLQEQVTLSCSGLSAGCCDQHPAFTPFERLNSLVVKIDLIVTQFHRKHRAFVDCWLALFALPSGSWSARNYRLHRCGQWSNRHDNHYPLPICKTVQSFAIRHKPLSRVHRSTRILYVAHRSIALSCRAIFCLTEYDLGRALLLLL